MYKDELAQWESDSNNNINHESKFISLDTGKILVLIIVFFVGTYLMYNVFAKFYQWPMMPELYFGK